MATEQRENEKDIAELMTTIESALDQLPLEDIKTVIVLAEGMIVKKQAEAKEAFLRELNEFKERAAKLGISLGSLAPAKTGKKAGKRGRIQAVKYRGPNGEEWAGRGIKPKWLQEAEKEGRNREEFRVLEHAVAQPA